MCRLTNLQIKSDDAVPGLSCIDLYNKLHELPETDFMKKTYADT